MTNELINQAKDTIEELGKATTKMTNIAEKEKATVMPYRDVLCNSAAGPPVQVNPRFRARESI